MYNPGWVWDETQDEYFYLDDKGFKVYQSDALADGLGPYSKQVGGNHYTKLKIQPLEYALANNLGIMEHAVVKYVSRHQDKGGKQDLEKAIDYLQKMIKHYYS